MKLSYDSNRRIQIANRSWARCSGRWQARFLPGLCAVLCLTLAVSCNFNTRSNVEPRNGSSDYFAIVPTSESELPLLWQADAPVPPEVRLSGFIQQWQTMNNCGPAALSMLLSYYGIIKTQDELGLKLRSCRDDPSVLLSQLEAEARVHGVHTIMLAGGTVELLRLLVANGFPVLVKIWVIETNEMQYGHSCIVSGYKGDDTFLITDSLKGTNVSMPVPKFDAMWRVFNRSLLVLARPGDETTKLDSLLLGSAKDFARAAVKTARDEIETGYRNAALYARKTDALAVGYFNLASSYAMLEAWDKADAAVTKAFAIGVLPRMLFYFPDFLMPWIIDGNYRRVLTEIEPYLRKNPFSDELQWYKARALYALKHDR